MDLDRRSPYPTLLLKHSGLKEVLFEPSGKFRWDFGMVGGFEACCLLRGAPVSRGRFAPLFAWRGSCGAV